jgi:DNA-directed RNA polymerase subunit M/transcription elongation factor TFIIS
MRVHRLNACPKCGGTILIGSDQYGQFLSCASCGWSKDLPVDKRLSRTRIHDDDPPEVQDGCNISASCFTCPLPDCLWEMPNSRLTYLWDQSALQVYAKHQHLGPAQAARLAAKELAVSERRIYRALQRRHQAA